MYVRQGILLIIFLFIGIIIPSFGNCEINKIVAWVNNDVITLQELNIITGANATVSKKEILQGLIEQKLILQEAIKQEIDVSDEQVSEIMNAMKKQFPTETAFEDALLKEGVTKEELAERYKENLTKQQLIGKEVTGRVKISTEKLNKIRSNFSCEIRVRHILVKSAEEAVLLLARIDRGEDFEVLAKECSICPSGKNGGDLGFFHMYQMIPEFSEVAFSLKIGDVSQVVKTNLGYHIIKMIEKREIQKDRFQILIQEQEEKLRKEAFEKEIDVWLKELKEKAYIVVDEEYS